MSAEDGLHEKYWTEIPDVRSPIFQHWFAGSCVTDCHKPMLKFTVKPNAPYFGPRLNRYGSLQQAEKLLATQYPVADFHIMAAFLKIKKPFWIRDSTGSLISKVTDNLLQRSMIDSNQMTGIESRGGSVVHVLLASILRKYNFDAVGILNDQDNASAEGGVEYAVLGNEQVWPVCFM